MYSEVRRVAPWAQAGEGTQQARRAHFATQGAEGPPVRGEGSRQPIPIARQAAPVSIPQLHGQRHYDGRELTHANSARPTLSYELPRRGRSQTPLGIPPPPRRQSRRPRDSRSLEPGHGLVRSQSYERRPYYFWGGMSTAPFTTK